MMRAEREPSMARFCAIVMVMAGLGACARDSLRSLPEPEGDSAPSGDADTVAPRGDDDAPAVACTLEALPQPLDFGHVITDELGLGGPVVSRALPVTVHNRGEIPCEINGFTPPGQTTVFRVAPAVPFTIDGGGSVELTVELVAPASDEPLHYNDVFHLLSPSYGPGDYPVQLRALAGGTVECELEVDPPGSDGEGGNLDFGLVNLGSSKTLPVHLENHGLGPCLIRDLRFSDDTTPDFTASIDGAAAGSTLTVAPGSSETIHVTYAPRPNSCSTISPVCLVWMNFLLFHLDQSGAVADGIPADYAVGLGAEYTTPDVDAIPGELDFGVVTLGCGSPELAVNVWNQGLGAQSVAGIALDPASDPTFVVTGAPMLAPDAPLVLESGDHLTVTVRFFPSRLGPHDGELIFTSNAAGDEILRVPLHGDGTDDPHQLDVFVVPDRPRVDVLWVVDDSESMKDEQQHLAANFSYFVSFALDIDADFHLGVITTDIRSERAGQLFACDPSQPFITSATIDPAAAFDCNVRVSDADLDHSDFQEGGLAAAKRALDEPLQSGANAGFLRDDAKLYVIFVSDEDDQSTGPVALYVDFFRSIKGYLETEMIAAAAIVGDLPNGCASGASVDRTAEAGPRYHATQQAVGGRFESICSDNWSDLLADLGFDSFGQRTEFFLTRLPDGPLAVRTGADAASLTGVPESATDGYAYRPASNSIVFTGSWVPGLGHRIEIEYDTACLP